MDVLTFLSGILLMIGAIWMFVDRQRTAEWLYGYYNAKPQVNLRPRWLFRQFRPTHNQAKFLSVVFAIALALGGAIFVAYSVIGL